jgi:amino acid transporter
MQWVHAALGRRAGFVGAICTCVMCILHLPLCLVMLKEYTRQMFPTVGDSALTVVAYGGLAVVTAVNVLGLTWVAKASIAFVLASVLVFSAQWFLVTLEPSRWTGVASPIKWDVFMGSLLWSFMGWDVVSSVAGEVVNPKVTYPLGVTVGGVLIIATYLLPVMGTCTTQSARAGARAGSRASAHVVPMLVVARVLHHSGCMRGAERTTVGHGLPRHYRHPHRRRHGILCLRRGAELQHAARCGVHGQLVASDTGTYGDSSVPLLTRCP